MTVTLPDLLTRYFAAASSNDWTSFAACFADHASVRDEGRRIEGPAAISQWMQDAKQKYQHRADPIAVAEEDGKTTVTTRVVGNFPGSPVNLDHIFTISDDRIVALEIH